MAKSEFIPLKTRGLQRGSIRDIPEPTHRRGSIISFLTGNAEASHAFAQSSKFEEVNINSGITLRDISTLILNA
jgi:hypothetical protein